VYVSPEYHRAGERVTAYAGSVTTTVTLVDFTVLGEVMMRLADQDQTTVYGPWWELRPDSQVHREARRAAISDAMVRAREYAEALGSRLVRLLEISDFTQGGPQPARPFGAVALSGGAARGGPPPALPLDPQVQTVQAQVEARFTMTEPTGLVDP
jgi:uncharacterized protein YggE